MIMTHYEGIPLLPAIYSASTATRKISVVAAQLQSSSTGVEEGFFWFSYVCVCIDRSLIEEKARVSSAAAAV